MVAAVAALSLATAAPAGAADQTLTEPYRWSQWEAHCQKLYVVCRANAFASSQTGVLSVDLAATGTQSRCFDFCGDTAGAFGEGEILTIHSLPTPASAVRYTIVIALERAEAQATGIGTFADAFVEGRATTDLYCSGACGSASMSLVSGTAAGSSTSPGERTLSLTLRRADGQPLQPGWINLEVFLHGIVRFDDALSSGGEGFANARLTLKRIDVTIDRTAQ